MRLRPMLWPLLFVLLAGGLYRARIQREMVDFDVYRTAATRAMHAEPLYRQSEIFARGGVKYELR